MRTTPTPTPPGQLLGARRGGCPGDHHHQDHRRQDPEPAPGRHRWQGPVHKGDRRRPAGRPHRHRRALNEGAPRSHGRGVRFGFHACL